ncbi:MAG: AMP-binding protein, partial [Gaiellales bacterium]
MSDHLWIPDAATIGAAQSTALARHLGLDSYEALLAYSVAEPEAFWDAAVRWLDLDWHEEWTQVLDASDGIAWARWFVGARGNLAWSCVGRHVAARGDHPAVVVEHEDLSITERSFAELWDEVGRLGRALLDLGVGEGDRVAIVLPMGAEAVAALYAAARIGAIAVPIFSGFSAAAIATRFADCDVRAVIAAESTMRRGRPVPVRATVE